MRSDSSTPNSCLAPSGNVLMMVILGGMGMLTGGIVGAFAMMLLELGLEAVPFFVGVTWDALAIAYGRSTPWRS